MVRAHPVYKKRVTMLMHHDDNIREGLLAELAAIEQQYTDSLTPAQKEAHAKATVRQRAVILAHHYNVISERTGETYVAQVLAYEKKLRVEREARETLMKLMLIMCGRPRKRWRGWDEEDV